MSVYDRPMFRRKMGGATGIMASGPELIRRASGGGLNILSSANANPLLTGDNQIIQIPQGGGTIKVPFFGKKQPLDKFNTEIETPGSEFGRNPIVNPISFGAIPGTNPAENILTDDLEKDKSGTFGKKINKSSEKILESKLKPSDENTSFGFGEGDKNVGVETENVETPDKNISKESNITGGSGTFDKELSLTNEMIARNRTALTDMASLEDKEFFGTTANKVTQELFDEYDKEGKEVTLADVRDKGIKILGFDPDKLEENFDEDRRSALFLRIMQAGLAIAAGESDNALTNVAKGLSVGLAGYGDDVKFLSKEMKADRREAANTMYRLLGDAKSEQLAKEALNLQKKVAQQQIVSSKVGKEKENLLKELELKNANSSLKLNFYSAMRDQNFKEKKFQIEQNQFDKSLNATLQKIPSNELKTLYDAGEVTLIDERKGLIPGNYTVSEKGKKLMEGILKDEFGGKITDKKQKRASIGKFGNVEGITNPNFEYEDGTLKNQTDIVDMGVLQEQLNEGPYKKQIQDGEFRAAGETLIALAKQRGFKIDLSKLNPAVKKALGERKSGDRIIDESLLNDPVFFSSTD